MAKLILCFMLGISLIKEKFKTIFIETDKIIYLENDGASYIYNDTYKIMYKNIIIYENDNYEDLSFCKVDNNIYVLLKDNDYYCINKYSLSGNLVGNIKLFNAYNNLRIINIDGSIYLYGGINTNLLIRENNLEESRLNDNDLKIIELNDYLVNDTFNGFIINLNKNLEIISLNIYIGRCDEEFINILFDNEYLYINCKCGTNDGSIYQNSNEDSYDLIIFDKGFNHVKTIIFDKEIKNINKVDEDLILCLDYEIIQINCLDFSYTGLKLPFKSDFFVISSNYLVFSIWENKGYLVDIVNRRIILNIDIDLYDIKCLGKYLYLMKEEHYFILDVIDEEYFYDDIKYGYYSNNNYLDGLYGRYILVDEVSDPYFNNLVYGKYNYIYTYKLDDLVISLNSVIEVEEAVNVNEEFIYPVGYHLFFNGKGKLNGNVAYQNEELVNNGFNNLVLEGISETKEIKIKTSSDQVMFSDDLISSYDYIGRCGDYFKIIINANTDINKVVINNEYYECFKEDDHYYVNVLIKEGVNGYFILKGVSTDNEIAINYFLKILGLKDVYFNGSCRVINEDNLVRVRINISEGNEYLRMIVVKVKDNLYYYPLGNNSIRLDQEEACDFSLYLGFYNGSDYLDLVKIMDGMVSGKEICNNLIINKQEYLEEIELSFSKNGDVSSLEFSNQYLKLNSEDNNYLRIMIVFVLFIIISSIIFITFKKKKKNK